MNDNFSLVSLIVHANVAVQFVVVLLIGFSLLSWTMIFRKISVLRRERGLNNSFENSFWSGSKFSALYAVAVRNVTDARLGGSMERVFANGMNEFQKLRDKRITDPETVLEGSLRAMRSSLQREVDNIESSLSFLASVGTVSPYIGLFGTVWGIMHAFVGLSSLAQVTLATVAPGIAEALVTTAIGLFVAIPAVLFYNYFSREIDRLVIRLETFIDDFSNILRRNLASRTEEVT